MQNMWIGSSLLPIQVQVERSGHEHRASIEPGHDTEWRPSKPLVGTKLLVAAWNKVPISLLSYSGVLDSLCGSAV